VFTELLPGNALLNSVTIFYLQEDKLQTDTLKFVIKMTVEAGREEALTFTKIDRSQEGKRNSIVIKISVA
jgi:hypothetical protein